MSLPVKWRHFRVTCSHLRSRDVISCHVIASSRELQPCKKQNVQFTPVLSLPQPLPDHLLSNDVTFGSLQITWAHVTSFPVMWLPPPANYSLAGSEMYSVRQFSAFHSHFQVTSCQMTSLSGHFRSPEVTWRLNYCHVTASCKLQPCRKWNVQYTRVLGLLQPLPGDFRWNDVTHVTANHLRSRDVISCHVTASSCELQPCKKWNVQYTPVFVPPQPLPGHFRSNDGTSRSLPVSWGHVTSFPITWQPPPASFSLVGSEMYGIRQFSAFNSCFQVTSGQMTSLPGNFRSPEVTWCHFL